MSLMENCTLSPNWSLSLRRLAWAALPLVSQPWPCCVLGSACRRVDLRSASSQESDFSEMACRVCDLLCSSLPVWWAEGQCLLPLGILGLLVPLSLGYLAPVSLQILVCLEPALLLVRPLVGPSGLLVSAARTCPEAGFRLWATGEGCGAGTVRCTLGIGTHCEPCSRCCTSVCTGCSPTC